LPKISPYDPKTGFNGLYAYLREGLGALRQQYPTINMLPMPDNVSDMFNHGWDFDHGGGMTGFIHNDMVKLP
jgi:hypothetical protein